MNLLPELGHFALCFALGLALVVAIAPMIGSFTADRRRAATLMALAPVGTLAIFSLVLFSFTCLALSFAQHDFTVALVAQHSNSALPLPYRIAATWGSHEGSILLWILMLSGWSTAVVLFSQSLEPTLRIRVLSVLASLTFGFLLFTLFTSNPFSRMFPSPADGRDLNPLLQDPGMVFHPPLLYMGYVGFAVAFAFAVAGLIGGRFDAAWARWARPWTTVAWSFLTLGICLGSFWAYYELGWGGWWFWDPVENASFMPWLVGTALIHSLAVTEKRGAFRSWTILLAILAFSLSLLGTFLVRSGVLTSVHAFATDPTRGVFILAFLVVVIGGSLTLFAFRANKIQGGPTFAALSRESMLLANNVLMVVAACAVLLGTLYPLIIDTLGMGKISVGPPYFDAVFYPLMAPAMFLMGIGPLTRWKQSELPALATRLKWAAGIAVVAALLLPLTLTGFQWMTSLGLLFGFWIIGSTLTGLQGTRLSAQPAHFWGMICAHIGIGLFVLGVTMVKSYENDVQQVLAPGQTLKVNDQYEVKFVGVEAVKGPNFDALQGTFELVNKSNAGAAATVLLPQKRNYRAGNQTMTEAAIDRSLSRDIYISMGEPMNPKDVQGSWAVRVYLKPFVNWVWIGCVFMGLGGFIAVADKRYRRLKQPAKATGAQATA
jgi:cytochrome c-type biogenesis protein CcmF